MTPPNKVLHSLDRCRPYCGTAWHGTFLARMPLAAPRWGRNPVEVVGGSPVPERVADEVDSRTRDVQQGRSVLDEYRSAVEGS